MENGDKIKRTAPNSMVRAGSSMMFGERIVDEDDDGGGDKVRWRTRFGQLGE